MNKLRKKSILLIFFILSLLVNQKSLADKPNDQVYKEINYPKKKILKKKKSFLNKKKNRPSQKKIYQYKSKRKLRGATRILGFARIPEISKKLLNEQETIESSRGDDKKVRLQKSINYLAEINKEIANSTSGITIGEYTIPTEITQEVFKKTIAPQIALLVELAVIRSLIKLDDKIQPHVFTPETELNSLIATNSREFNNAVQESSRYEDLASINSAALNKLILELIAIYNTEIEKEKNETRKEGYIQKIKNYFKPGETKYIIKQIDTGLEKSKKAYDIFYGAADKSLPSKTLKKSMIGDIMYGIGIKKANIFEKLQTTFISDMATAISIQSSPKKDEMDPEAERKKANFKEYSQAYTKLVGISFYPIKKTQGFYSRAKQFITAAENRGLLKTAAAVVGATVIGGVLAKDIYSAKELNNTWADAIQIGARHTAGRPANLAKSAWEAGSKKYKELRSKTAEEAAQTPEEKGMRYFLGKDAKGLTGDEVKEMFDKQNAEFDKTPEEEAEEKGMRYFLGKTARGKKGYQVRDMFDKKNAEFDKAHAKRAAEIAEETEVENSRIRDDIYQSEGSKNYGEKPSGEKHSLMDRARNKYSKWQQKREKRAKDKEEKKPQSDQSDLEIQRQKAEKEDQLYQKERAADQEKVQKYSQSQKEQTSDEGNNSDKNKN